MIGFESFKTCFKLKQKQEPSVLNLIINLNVMLRRGKLA